MMDRPFTNNFVASNGEPVSLDSDGSFDLLKITSDKATTAFSSKNWVQKDQDYALREKTHKLPEVESIPSPFYSDFADQDLPHFDLSWIVNDSQNSPEREEKLMDLQAFPLAILSTAIEKEAKGVKKRNRKKTIATFSIEEKNIGKKIMHFITKTLQSHAFVSKLPHEVRPEGVVSERLKEIVLSEYIAKRPIECLKALMQENEEVLSYLGKVYSYLKEEIAARKCPHIPHDNERLYVATFDKLLYEVFALQRQKQLLDGKITK
eukprot:TRINITY_DN108780_c0_g1_i1.p1 TRINITY_DN108780_c0_g1~~TRINITY_DN108780_c0_g1_i1.p1  ORF type:complete len:293 (-),score=33.77 TRINITY_DN108780_c0_g1_i1:130-921(-)